MVLIHQLHVLLQHQQLHYHIYVVHQVTACYVFLSTTLTHWFFSKLSPILNINYINTTFSLIVARVYSLVYFWMRSENVLTVARTPPKICSGYLILIAGNPTWPPRLSLKFVWIFQSWLLGLALADYLTLCHGSPTCTWQPNKIS